MHQTHRRGFLGWMGKSAAALGLAAFAAPSSLRSANSGAANPASPGKKSEADMWFDQLKGKHRVVFDATQPHEAFPFAWPKVFLLTNGMTGSPESDCGVVVVLRHSAICYAFDDTVWKKYNFGEVFKAGGVGPLFQASDAATATKVRNPFNHTSKGDFQVPGVGDVAIGITDLQSSGVMFCVCQTAMTVYANVIAGMMKLKPEDVIAEWEGALLPGVQKVPSGVWALGRAQERGCAYIFAG